MNRCVLGSRYVGHLLHRAIRSSSNIFARACTSYLLTCTFANARTPFYPKLLGSTPISMPCLYLHTSSLCVRARPKHVHITRTPNDVLSFILIHADYFSLRTINIRSSLLFKATSGSFARKMKRQDSVSLFASQFSFDVPIWKDLTTFS